MKPIVYTDSRNPKGGLRMSRAEQDAKAKVEYLQIPKGKRLLFVSDIHGNRNYFHHLMKKAGFGKEDILFLLGDLIEKGPDSLGLLRDVMELQKTHTVYVLSGNCEGLWSQERILNPQSRKHLQDYLMTRGGSIVREMMAEQGISMGWDTNLDEVMPLLGKIYEKEFSWLRSLPQILVTEHLLLVHAGLVTGVPLEEQNKYLVMDFAAFYHSDAEFTDRICITGHWPVVLYHSDVQDAAPIVDLQRNMICLDGGNVLKKDGQLNCLILPSEDSREFSYISYDDYPQAVVTDTGYRGIEKEISEGSEGAFRESKGAFEESENVFDESEEPTNITWSENAIEFLSEAGDCAYVRQISSGKEFLVPSSYLYLQKHWNEKEWTLHVEDITSDVLRPSVGELISVVEQTGHGMIIKQGSRSGWFYGTCRMLEDNEYPENTEVHPAGYWQERQRHLKAFEVHQS